MSTPKKKTSLNDDHFRIEIIRLVFFSNGKQELSTFPPTQPYHKLQPLGRALNLPTTLYMSIHAGKRNHAINE